MNTKALPIHGLNLAATKPLTDERGIFARLFCAEELGNVLNGRQIVNVNFSKNFKKGTIRGLHFQRPPMAEMKFVRCLKGRIFDVAVDIRANSPTFLRWHGVELSADDMNMVCIEEGFAHGFQILEDNAELLYLHTQYYSKADEDGLNYADPKLAIDWPLKAGTVSDKDAQYPMIDADFKGVQL